MLVKTWSYTDVAVNLRSTQLSELCCSVLESFKGNQAFAGDPDRIPMGWRRCFCLRRLMWKHDNCAISGWTIPWTLSPSRQLAAPVSFTICGDTAWACEVGPRIIDSAWSDHLHKRQLSTRPWRNCHLVASIDKVPGYAYNEYAHLYIR